LIIEEICWNRFNILIDEKFKLTGYYSRYHNNRLTKLHANAVARCGLAECKTGFGRKEIFFQVLAEFQFLIGFGRKNNF